VSSRDQQDRVGPARSHRGLTVGEMAAGGHRWPSAGGKRELTGGAASLVREGGRALADGRHGLFLLGQTERVGRGRERGARVRAAGEAGSRPAWTVFVFLFSKNAK
jgi:hypothetical protein